MPLAEDERVPLARAKLMDELAYDLQIEGGIRRKPAANGVKGQAVSRDVRHCGSGIRVQALYRKAEDIAIEEEGRDAVTPLPSTQKVLTTPVRLTKAAPACSPAW